MLYACEGFAFFYLFIQKMKKEIWSFTEMSLCFRIVTRQAVFMKKALVDLWQLAFSYQVNPLAAVQPLAAVTRGGQWWNFQSWPSLFRFPIVQKSSHANSLYSRKGRFLYGSCNSFFWSIIPWNCSH